MIRFLLSLIGFQYETISAKIWPRFYISNFLSNCSSYLASFLASTGGIVSLKGNLIVVLILPLFLHWQVATSVFVLEDNLIVAISHALPVGKSVMELSTVKMVKMKQIVQPKSPDKLQLQPKDLYHEPRPEVFYRDGMIIAEMGRINKSSAHLTLIITKK